MSSTVIRTNPLSLVLDSNVRPGDWRVDEMVRDLIAAGRQLQPIGITQPDMCVVFGFRRAAALQKICQENLVPENHPLREAWCLVIEDTDAQNRLKLQILENTARLNFSPIEEAQIISQMRRTGYKIDAIAAIFRRSKGWVSQRLSLLNLPEDVQALIPDKVSAYEGYLLSQMDEVQMRRRLSAMMRAAPTRHDLSTVRRRQLIQALERHPVDGTVRPVIEALILLLRGQIDVDRFVEALKKAPR